MEGQEYLNQLAASARPVKKPKSSFLSSKLFIGGIIALVLLVLIIILSVILGGDEGGEKNLGYALKLHLDNTSEMIKTYQNNVKSSELRSSSASFDNVLSNTSRELTDYLKEKYKIKEKNVNKKIAEQAEKAKEELNTELFKAKINGILDRIYAHKMAYEISILKTEEARLMEVSKNQTLKDSLASSYNSLENLYERFNSFSEAK